MGGTFRPYKRMVKRQGKDPRGIISQRGRRGKELDGWTGGRFWCVRLRRRGVLSCTSDCLSICGESIDWVAPILPIQAVIRRTPYAIRHTPYAIRHIRIWNDLDLPHFLARLLGIADNTDPVH